jgi:hypothetical protein
MINGTENASYGNSSEILFDYHATIRGLTVSVPISSTLTPYDRIVDNGSGLFKVQIKSTSVKNRRGNFFIKLYKSSARKKQYKNNDVDFFVVHIHETGDYYIIPFHKASSTVTITPGVKGKYEEFLNKWELFKTDVRI